MTSISNASEDHIREIAEMVRQADRDELWASAMTTPEQAMRLGIQNSERSFTGWIDGKPVVMWGVVDEGFVGRKGTPWMVATDTVEKNAMLFLRRSRGLTKEIMLKYRRLENYVDARNTLAINWLKWIGFTMEAPEPFGVFDLPFHKFWQENSHV